MSQTTTELKEEIQKSLGLIRTLKDEIRLKVHLANMDVKEEWRKIEPRIADVERAAGELTQATCAALSETVKRLSTLRDRVR